MAISRRRMLFLVSALPLLGQLPFAHAATRRDLRFQALWQGSPVGEHRVAFRSDGERLTVDTHIDITVKVLFFTVFRLKHDSREIWQSDRLLSLSSTTERDGVHHKISGDAVRDGFLMAGGNGPFLAAAELLTSNSLWNSRIVREARLIDVQHGGEVGMVARLLGEEQVDTPEGQVRASRYRMITPYYAGSVFYDTQQRWVKALIESKGETLEYALAA